MMKKHCLFCDEIVPIRQEGDYDTYVGCSCSPGGSYSLRRDSYDTINAFPHQQKRDLFYVISAYIRELTDRDEQVTLSANDLEPIANDPSIPVTIEDKGNRLLQYLFRHSEAAGEPVVIHPLSGSCNLTYSPNMQELVYIIDKLTSDQLLSREGIAFKLTEKGWREAFASAGGKKLKPCCVLVGDDGDLRKEWVERLLPKVAQFGYLPRMLSHSTSGRQEKYSLELIADSKLIVADLTGQCPGVYFAAGYALGLNIPVLWTVNGRDAGRLIIHTEAIRPLVWNTAEELAAILQQRLTALAPGGQYGR